MTQLPESGMYTVICPRCTQKDNIELKQTQTLFICSRCNKPNLALLAKIRSKHQKTKTYDGFSARKFFVRVFTMDGEALVSALYSKVLTNPPDIILHNGDTLVLTVRADGKKDVYFYNATIDKYYRAGKLLDSPLKFVHPPREPTKPMSKGCKTALWSIIIMAFCGLSSCIILGILSMLPYVNGG